MAAAIAGAATAAGGFELDQSLGIDGLDFDDPQPRGRGLEGELGAIGAAFVQNVEHEFFPVEHPFQIDEFQIQIPLRRSAGTTFQTGLRNPPGLRVC